MATLLARKKRIIVNNNLKKQKIHSDWAVVIKKILMNMPKEMIVTALAEFGEIKSIKIQLIGMWQKAVVEFTKSDQANLLVFKWLFLIGKNSVCVAKAVEDCETWASRNQFRALLFTLPVGMTAHDFRTLLERVGRKTCIINRSLETGNKICCVVVGFESNDDLESAFCTKSIYNRIKLSWAKINLVCCIKYRHFGYSALKCDALEILVLPSSKKSYKKFTLEEACFRLAKLYKKKDVSISCSAAFGSKFWVQVVLLANFFDGACFKSGSSSFPLGILCLGSIFSSTSDDNSGLSDYLAVLKHFLELLSDQVSVLLKKSSFMKLVLLTVSLSAPSLVVFVFLAPVLNSDMVLDNVLVSSTPFPSVGSDLVVNFSSSNSKVLTTKIADKFDGVCVFTSGLDSEHLGSGVAIIMNSSLAKHVCKVFEVPDQIFSIRLLFKNKLSVLILGLYAGASSGVQFSQAVSVVVDCDVMDIGDHFNTDYHAVSVSVGDGNRFAFLIECWDSLDNVKALIVQKIVNSGAGFDHICSAFFSVQKTYYASKLAEFLQAEESKIRSAIDKQIENFAVNKGNTIRSMLERSFQKVVLNHLVVGDELILEPDLVKAKVDIIMEGWTRKHNVVKDFSDNWSH
ncbi:hypothetical protein G9A89_004061 [Geosiphon pyriformis]|nr:hypothetical protein G9A89_004061 [Geosiphon pyriformis]